MCVKKNQETVKGNTQTGLSSPKHVLEWDEEMGEKEEKTCGWVKTEQPERFNKALLWFGIIFYSSDRHHKSSCAKKQNLEI